MSIIIGGTSAGGNLAAALTALVFDKQMFSLFDIFKKSKVNYISGSELNTGNDGQYSYFLNWSSGRYPVIYDVNFISGKLPLLNFSALQKSEKIK